MVRRCFVWNQDLGNGSLVFHDFLVEDTIRQLRHHLGGSTSHGYKERVLRFARVHHAQETARRRARATRTVRASGTVYSSRVYQSAYAAFVATQLCGWESPASALLVPDVADRRRPPVVVPCGALVAMDGQPLTDDGVCWPVVGEGRVAEFRRRMYFPVGHKDVSGAAPLASEADRQMPPRHFQPVALLAGEQGALEHAHHLQLTCTDAHKMESAEARFPVTKIALFRTEDVRGMLTDVISTEGVSLASCRVPGAAEVDCATGLAKLKDLMGKKVLPSSKGALCAFLCQVRKAAGVVQVVAPSKDLRTRPPMRIRYADATKVEGAEETHHDRVYIVSAFTPAIKDALQHRCYVNAAARLRAAPAELVRTFELGAAGHGAAAVGGGGGAGTSPLSFMPDSMLM